MLRIKGILNLAAHEYSSLQRTQIGQVRRGGEIKDKYIEHIYGWSTMPTPAPESLRLQFLPRTSFDPSFRLSWFFSLKEKEKDLGKEYKFRHTKGCKGTAGGKDCTCKQLQQLLRNEAYEGNSNQYLNFNSEKISGPHRNRNSTQDTDFSYFLRKTSHLHLEMKIQNIREEAKHLQYQLSGN